MSCGWHVCGVLCLGLLWFMLIVGLEFWDGKQNSVSYMLEVILTYVTIKGRAADSLWIP